MSEDLRIIREASNLPEDIFTRLQDAFAQIARDRSFSKGKKRSLFRVTGQLTQCAMLLTAGDLQHYLRVNEIDLGTNGTDELADYLEEALPERLDKSIYAETLSMSVVSASSLKRILIIGNTPEIEEEATITRNTVDDFFNKSNINSWPEQLPWGGIPLAKTSHAWSDDVIDAAAEAMHRIQGELPPFVCYEPAIIDET